MDCTGRVGRAQKGFPSVLTVGGWLSWAGLMPSLVMLTYRSLHSVTDASLHVSGAHVYGLNWML